MASKESSKPTSPEVAEDAAKRPVKRRRYATSEDTRLIEHPGAVATAPQTEPETTEVPDVVEIHEITLQLLGDMVIGPADGVAGQLGGKKTAPLVRDPRNGRLYNLVAL